MFGLGDRGSEKTIGIVYLLGIMVSISFIVYQGDQFPEWRGDISSPSLTLAME